MPKIRYLPVLVCVASILSTACDRNSSDITQKHTQEHIASFDTDERDVGDQNLSAQIDEITDEYYQYLLTKNISLRLRLGLTVTQFPDITFSAVKQEATYSRQLLKRLQSIPLDSLPHNKLILKRLLEHTLWSKAEAPVDYWTSFVITPYSARGPIGSAINLLPLFVLKTVGDRENYLNLVGKYNESLNQVIQKTAGQKERGILLPKPAIPGARSMIEGSRNSVAKRLADVDARLEGVSEAEVDSFKQELANRLEDVDLSFSKLLAVLDKEYMEQAPEEVGLGQYPGGKEAYKYRIKMFTGLDLDPEEIHKLGMKRLEEIGKKQEVIRRQLGYTGSAVDFKQSLQKDPRFYAKTVAEVKQNYQRYISMLEPLLKDYFMVVPETPYGVRRLKPEQEAGLTYGYYSGPTPLDPTGYYNFNGSKLDERTLITAQHLIYHELLPGHHFHVATELENKSRHPIHKALGNTAFTEGWAEYATSLGVEMGLFSDPYDMYGHLLFQAFFANRLVVDTGMNYFGWPLEKAREFMSTHTIDSRVQVNSETIRYSTDMPGQALNYLLGFEKIRELRHRAEAKLGDSFDIREFHAQIVGEAGMPLHVLEDHIDWYIENTLTQQ